MNTPLFTGDLVRLTAQNPETDAELMARWSHDAEYLRLLDTEPARPVAAQHFKELLEKDEETPHTFFFRIRSLADDRPLGFIGLNDVAWTHGEAWLAVGLGARDDWGRGYGTDALRVVLRYAFHELNLHRVSLNVFETNPRARRAYEKVGFVVEGRQRQAFARDGRRWDLIFMGILRDEWESLARR